jgi:hypothetical protein
LSQVSIRRQLAELKVDSRILTVARFQTVLSRSRMQERWFL